MQKIVSVRCPKCNNNHLFYRYGKDKFGNQKYQCRKCWYQFAPDSPIGKPGAKLLPPDKRKYPSCPRCGKSTFLHHQCPNCSAKQILNGCVTLCRQLSQH